MKARKIDNAIQGDQIGRIFANWAFVKSEQFFNYRRSRNIKAIFNTAKVMY
jgi:hypothetical protein